MNLKHGILICAFASLFATVSVFAQAGARGGGQMTEAEMQTYINRLSSYLSTPEGQRVFPEVVIHDRIAKPSFHDIASQTYPVAKPGVQHDQFGNSRTCVSFRESDKRYFVCDQDEMDTGLEHQPRDYEIILHELFVQSGIERPVTPNIPSEYKISSRILNHLFQDPALGFLPGDLPKNPITKNGLWCTDQPSLLSDEVASQAEIRVLFWSADGNVRFVEWKMGIFQDLFLGYAPLPQSVGAATVPPAFPLAGSYKFAPLHSGGGANGPSIWLAMNDNLVMAPASTTLSGAPGIWTQVLANAIIDRPGTSSSPGIESHLVACQAMESWKNSSLYPFLNPVLNHN